MADCKTCNFENICEMPEFVRNNLKDCKVYEVKKKQTNADRIRVMTDEELARKRIDRIDMYTSSDLKEYIGDFAGIVNSEEEAIKKELEWLQSEAEEPHD